MKEQVKSFWFYLGLCLIWTFAHGLFLRFLPDEKTVKMVVELLVLAFISVSLFLRAPQQEVLKFTCVNGFILFMSVALSSYFTYFMISHSRYYENWGIATMMQLLLSLVVTYCIALFKQSLWGNRKRRPLSNDF